MSKRLHLASGLCKKQAHHGARTHLVVGATLRAQDRRYMGARTMMRASTLLHALDTV
jgi:hypothetical protein